MDTTIDNAAQALRDPDRLTAEQCRAYQDALSPERMRLDTALAEFYNPNAHSDEWRRRLALGEDIDALREEYQTLKAEHDRVLAQSAMFQRQERAARSREAKADLPDSLDDLDKAASKVEKARAKLVEACEAFERQYQSTTTTIGDAGVGAGNGAGAELAERVVEVANDASFTPTGPLYHRATKRPQLIGSDLATIERQAVPVFG